jgi:nucleoside-diphosphate-sugar epimerase/phosphohistidine swiveling domain-containing protein
VRVGVTGATGVFGRDVVRRLVMSGHDVVGISRRTPDAMPVGSRHARADVRDLERLTAALSGCDAVVHLAWTVTPVPSAAQTRALDVGGTANVLEAMSRTGAKRLVMASSVMSYGSRPDNPELLTEDDPLRPADNHPYSLHKRETEQMITESGVDALLVRAGSVIGRGIDGITQSTFSGPLLPGVKGFVNRMQFVHPEDVGRFFAQAVEERWTGPVNLAAPDTITMEEIARLLGKRCVRVSRATLERITRVGWRRGFVQVDPGSFDALLWFPCVDTRRLRDELGFRCGYSSRECVEDFALSGRGDLFVARFHVRIPWRIGWHGAVPGMAQIETDSSRLPGAAHDVAGEFDTTVDPAFPVFTATNTGEAFPRPLTPLSIDLARDSMRVSVASTCTTVLRLPDAVARDIVANSTGVFGHGIYANLSAIHHLASMLPGYDPATYDENIFGSGSGDVSREHVALSRHDKARLVSSMLPKLFALDGENRRIAAQELQLRLEGPELAAATDEHLLARACALKDAVCDAWSVAAGSSLWVNALLSALEKQTGAGFASRIRGGADDLESAGAMRGLHDLAFMLRSDPGLMLAMDSMRTTDDILPALRHVSIPFADRFARVLREYGHRGPAETELAASVFADAPGRLLEAARKLAQVEPRTLADPPPMSLKLRCLAAATHAMQQRRERARDTTVRTTHSYRIVARERGRRLTERGVLAAADDVWYLTHGELQNPPADSRQRVQRRRAERLRLAALRMPNTFTLRWDGEIDGPMTTCQGDVLTGIGVSAGTARGRVHVLDADSLDDLEPGEVLVAKVTDAGWSPMFASAAAVVTSMGGQMSHAAVVAREYGIPCVVQVDNVTTRLTDGMAVEVDGAAGTVTVVEKA